MNTATHILSTLCILLVGLCFTACSSHDEYVDDAVVETDDGQYIKLMLHVPAEERTTRAANPTPGENGDGREDGVRHENEIKNVMVFVIRDNNHMNADEATTFLYKGYIDESFSGWKQQSYGVDILFPVKDYRPENNDKVIVVANAGARQNEINTLGDLRNFQLTYAWRYGASLADNDMFVMSSAVNDDGLVVLSSHDGTIGDPYLSSLTIQRLAARIDFMYNNTDNGDPSAELLYKVTIDPNDRSSEQLASVHLENIIPVNLMQQPSYIIKRVTTSGGGINSAVTYCGQETASVAPTNYVIEPHTIAKESSVEVATLSTWYGSTRAKTVFSNPTSYLTNTRISDYTSTIVAGTDLPYFTHHFTIAYTNENTQSMAQHKPQYMTGLLLRAVYEPAKVYSSYAAGVLTPSSTYTRGKTFWRYSPTRTEMREENCLYFDNETAADAYNSTHPMDMGTVEMFTNGICYYNIWLRHANVERNPHETFPMEFGIVRNNIYRVGVRIFTGPGTPMPSLNGPDHLRLRIFVRKWNYRLHNKIYL